MEGVDVDRKIDSSDIQPRDGFTTFTFLEDFCFGSDLIQGEFGRFLIFQIDLKREIIGT